jgi:hypothetical protein
MAAPNVNSLEDVVLILEELLDDHNCVSYDLLGSYHSRRVETVISYLKGYNEGHKHEQETVKKA